MAGSIELIEVEFCRRVMLEGLKRFNQTEEPWLQWPKGYGTRYIIPTFRNGKFETLFEMKVRGFQGWFNITDAEMRLAESRSSALIDALVKNLREAEAKWGYMAKPRNHYFIDSFEVFTQERPHANSTAIGWKGFFVVMPRGWRKKMWKARRG